METKKLYVLVGSGGDGSFHTKYVMDDAVIEKLQLAYDEGEMDCEYGIGVDGDGFHYDTLVIPEYYTAEMLSLSKWKFITMDSVSDYTENNFG